MADSVEISFVDENDFVKEGKWYFLSENSQWDIMRTSEEIDARFRLKLKHILSGIDISQPTPWFSLSVPLFSLAVKYLCQIIRKAITPMDIRNGSAYKVFYAVLDCFVWF